MAKDECGKKFVSGEGELTCDRSGRHIVHKDSDTTFVRAPGGAVIKPKK